MNRILASLSSRLRLLLRLAIRRSVLDIINTEIRVYGDRGRLSIAPTADMINTLFNTVSGSIEVGELTFTGHNVSIITGTHDCEALLSERLLAIPRNGRDIIIGRGVWIGSNAIILGPCKLGDHSVIGAGSVVLPETEVPEGALFVGVPARQVKTIAGFSKGPK